MANIIQKIDYNITNFMSRFLQGKKKTYGLNTTEKRDREIIISLTSIPSRIETLNLCIERLMNQTMKPDRIIIWLSSKNFSDVKVLPKKLTSLCDRGLEIRWKEEDLNCHKKYFYTMKEYPEAIVITVDDDVLYSRRLVEVLYTSYIRYPKAVSAMRIHKICFNAGGGYFTLFRMAT